MRRGVLLLAFLLCACDGLEPVVAPLPEGGLPAAQTLEGGAQIRITPTGFQKIASTIPAELDAAMDAGFCLARSNIQGNDVCFTNAGGCTQGCPFTLSLNSVNVSVTNANRLNLRIDTSASAPVRIDPPIFTACTLTLAITNMVTDLDVGLSIDPATGNLAAQIVQINTFDAGGVDYGGCSQISNLASIVTDLLDSVLGTWILDSVTPAIQGILAGRMPAPVELAGLVDLPALALVGAEASNASLVETRVAPGGYVILNNLGLSLGVITGFNADADPATRTPALVSQPHPCVAELAAPDLGAPPFSLAQSSRGSFVLPGAGSFLGMPEPAADVAIGLSNTALDLAGHHIAASGGLCLDVETARVGFVRRDVLDELLGVALAAADSDLRLRVVPHGGVHFAFGTGLAEDPHLTAFLDDLEIEVDAVAGEAATPALTLAADVEIGFQYGTRSDAGAARLEPTRVSLRVLDPAVTAHDSRYASLDPGARAALVATAADVVFASLGADAGALPLPRVAGHDLVNTAVSRVDTASDAFLAVTASLGSAPAPGDPAPAPAPGPVTVDVPEPAALRAALAAGSDAELPTVHVAVPDTDGARALEHAWRTKGGVWRPYEATGALAIRDRSFAWQGEHEIELRSRAVGDDSTTSAIASLGAVIDYAPPALFVEPLDLEGPLEVPARDAVSAALEFALGRVGESEPETAWSATSSFDRSAALALGDSVVVYVRDEAGRVAQAMVQLVPEPVGAAVVALACLARLARRP